MSSDITPTYSFLFLTSVHIMSLALYQKMLQTKDLSISQNGICTGSIGFLFTDHKAICTYIAEKNHIN
jgi:hypothetical protein